jgi:flagellar assembly factor FliW
MAQALTRDFATIDYDPKTEIHFPEGLPGFGNEKRFLLIEKETLAPLVFLQSLTNPALCFLAVSVFVADPGYQIGNMQDDDEMVSCGDSLCLAILTESPNGGFTANLLAPVIINLQTRSAVQAVRSDALYSHQHPLNQTVDDDVC